MHGTIGCYWRKGSRPATPGKRIEVAQLAKRQRNVAAIANDVNKECFGNLLHDGRQPATVSGLETAQRATCCFRAPSPITILRKSPLRSVLQHLCGQFSSVESRSSETLAARPCGHNFLTVFESI